MKIAADKVETTCPETDVYHRLLSLDNKHILELGCGSAMITRDIATAGEGRTITALEVDEVAHEKNQRLTDLPNVTFGLAGAQAIPLEKDTMIERCGQKSIPQIFINGLHIEVGEFYVEVCFEN